jgi:hypothetical protein
MSKARELSKLPNYVLSTVAELKLAVGKEQGDKAFVGGYYADGDGGGGDFYWDAVSVEADNGGTIFQATGTTTGRWKRIYSGAVNVKWFGAKGDGLTDDTITIQSAIAYNKDTYIPDGTYMIKSHTTPSGGTAGLQIPSNITISFATKAFLKAITNDADLYSIMYIANVTNVTINNCNLIGDRDTHTGTTGEFGMGIYMRNSTDVTINGGLITKCWGDGLYLGQQSSVGGSYNITLNNLIVDENRRNGISVISVDGLYANNCTFSNTNGTDPQCGIDIEPNNDACYARNIVFNGCKLDSNAKAGFTCNFMLCTNSYTKDISISFNNCSANGNESGFEVSRLIYPYSGSINFTDCVITNSSYNGFKLRRLHKDGVKVNIINPLIVDWNRAGTIYDADGSAIQGNNLLADSTPTAGFGSLNIVDPIFKLNSIIGSGTSTEINLRDTTGGKVSNISITGVRNFSSNTLNVGDKLEWNLPTMSVTKYPLNAQGNWTPLYIAYTGTAHTSVNNIYAKVGNFVTLTTTVTFATNTDNSQVGIAGLPFTPYDGFSGAVGVTDYTQGLTWKILTSVIFLYKSDGTTIRYIDLSGKTISITAQFLDTTI